MNQTQLATSRVSETQPSAGIYTRPELREQLRNELLASAEGGAPGQWSPRKAELLTQAYRQAGGGYTFAKRTRWV